MRIGQLGLYLDTRRAVGTGGWKHNNSLGVLLKWCCNGGDGNGLTSFSRARRQRSRFSLKSGWYAIPFSATMSSLMHHLHGLNRIIALGSFTRKHDTIGTVKNGVTNIRDLRSGRARVVGHRFKHLGSANDRLTSEVTLGNRVASGQ